MVYLTPECAAAGGQQLVQAALQAVWHNRSLLDEPHVIPAALLAAAEAAGANAGAEGGNAVEAVRPDHDNAVTQGTQLQPGSAAGAAGDPADGQDDCGRSSCSSDDGVAEEQPMDDYLMPPAVSERIRPDVVYLTVPALPRG